MVRPHAAVTPTPHRGRIFVLYKVTPMLTPAQKPVKAKSDPDAPKQPRKRRKSAIFDGEGNEVLITMMCLKCRQMKPLGMFGLRKMADGAIRNQPWCRGCRSGASATKKKSDEVEETVETVQAAGAESAPLVPAPPSPAPEASADAPAPAGAE